LLALTCLSQDAQVPYSALHAFLFAGSSCSAFPYDVAKPRCYVIESAGLLVASARIASTGAEADPNTGASLGAADVFLGAVEVSLFGCAASLEHCCCCSSIVGYFEILSG
jgi:hypothetical protein